jgi:hypothetical protein
MVARDGDMWSCPFQCDTCWFVNLEERLPNDDCRIDERLLGYIRRVNLDVMWSREEGTVKGTMAQLRKTINMCDELGMERIELPIGAWPVRDNMGFRLAITMLRASQSKGRNDSSYVQFDSIRKMRSAFSNTYENSAKGNQTVLGFRADKGKAYRYSSCETESQLFAKFIRGLESRMGRMVQSNIGLHHKILISIVKNFDKELGDVSVPFERKRTIIVTGAYLMICFGASLRGNEGLYLEGSSLVSLIRLGNSQEDVAENLGHVCIPLLGRFKSEIGEDKHVAVVTNKSKSGLNFRLWLERLVWVLIKEKKDKVAGPAFCHKDGTMLRSFELDREFHNSLRIVQLERPDLIPEEIDITKSYGTFRSLRRGSLTKATEEGIEGPDLELINRWRKFENSKGGSPHMSMREHYLEIKLVLKRMLAYSKAL